MSSDAHAVPHSFKTFMCETCNLSYDEPFGLKGKRSLCPNGHRMTKTPTRGFAIHFLAGTVFGSIGTMLLFVVYGFLGLQFPALAQIIVLLVFAFAAGLCILCLGNGIKQYRRGPPIARAAGSSFGMSFGIILAVIFEFLLAFARR